MADKGKRMIFEDEYQYLKDLKDNHEDPTAPWGGNSDGIQIIDRDEDGNKTITLEHWEAIMEKPQNYAIVYNGYIYSYYREEASGEDGKVLYYMREWTDSQGDRKGFNIYSYQYDPSYPKTHIFEYSAPTSLIKDVKVNNVSVVTSQVAEITVPTTATSTSTSTVTPSTIQLTFTYSDNTTETVTLMTGASVSTTTTTSLS